MHGKRGNAKFEREVRILQEIPLFNKEERKKRKKSKKLGECQGKKHIRFNSVCGIWISSNSLHSTSSDNSDSDTGTDKGKKRNRLGDGNSNSSVFHKNDRKKIKIYPAQIGFEHFVWYSLKIRKETRRCLRCSISDFLCYIS